MKTGWTAWTFALAGFLLPYMFVYNNSLLLMGAAINVSFAVVTSVIGVICLGSGIIGYLIKETSIHKRVFLFSAAFLLIKPGLMTDLIGLGCVGMTLYLQLRKSVHSMPDRARP